MGLLETEEQVSPTPTELVREPIIHLPCQPISQYDAGLKKTKQNKKTCQLIQRCQKNQGGPSQPSCQQSEFQPVTRIPFVSHQANLS